MSDDQPRRMRVKRSREFYIIEKRLLRVFGSTIGAHGIALYNSLSSYANAGDDDVWPSVRQICAETGISDSTARRSIEKLERLGLVKVFETFDDDGHTSSTYEILDIPKAIPDAWESGPRPTRGIVDLRTNKNNPPPKPATSRGLTVCHTDRPGLSEGQARSISVTHQLKRQSRREKKGSTPLSPSSSAVQSNETRAPQAETARAAFNRKFAELRKIARTEPVTAGALPVEVQLTETEQITLDRMTSSKHHPMYRDAREIEEYVKQRNAVTAYTTKEQPR